MKIVLLAALVVALGGCAETVKYVPTSAPFCAAVKPVCISKDDVLTEGTATQVEANNLGISRVCKPRKMVCKAATPTS